MNGITPIIKHKKVKTLKSESLLIPNSLYSKRILLVNNYIYTC